ncbi:MAG: hypothetical protein WCP20_12910 [Desulfuromonadales bacterium]
MEPSKEETTGTTVNDSTSQYPSFLARQYSACDGGVQAEMNCPACDEEICGSYLPVFNCPHCESQIWRNESGDVISYEDCRRPTRHSLIASKISGVLTALIFTVLAGRTFGLKECCSASSSK